MTPQERAALVAWHLAHGDAMLTSQVAELAGITQSGALKLMTGLSRVLPIYQNDDLFWEVIEARQS